MKRPPARRGDPEFGRVCSCGGPKAKQAWNCQPCSEMRRGWHQFSKRELWARWRRTYMGGVRVVGDEDQALIAHARALAEARAEAVGELAVLVAEQERDGRLGHLSRDRWLVSLDATDRLGRPLYELVAA